MTRIIVVALQKGGVGKTTTTQHLAHALAEKGRRVLMIDLDKQASLTRRYDVSSGKGTMADVLGMEGPPTLGLKDIVVATYQDNLYLAPGSTDLKLSDDRLAGAKGGEFKVDVLLRDQKLPFDFIIIDTPPGKAALLDAALVAADEIVIPVQLSPMGFEGFEDIDETVVEARELQSLRGDIRLFYRAVVPTFYSKGEIISDEYLAQLNRLEHPDYKGQPLPLAPLPVPETTMFERASVPMLVETDKGAIEHARTIFELPSEGPNSPVERGKQAYRQLAEFVDVGP
jgi:chromosome partitioning protein